VFDNLDLKNIGFTSRNSNSCEKQRKALEQIMETLKSNRCSLWDFKLIYEEIVKCVLTGNLTNID
jgi:hypothetical protein